MIPFLLAMLSPRENEIVQLLQARNQRAIELIYQHYGSNLLAIIVRILGDQKYAEDVLQDAFVKIWINALKYDPKKGRLFTWLLNICRNTAIDKLRSKAFKNELALQEKPRRSIWPSLPCVILLILMKSV